jgi:hypothetical protein
MLPEDRGTMALEGIRVVGPTGGRERRRRKKQEKGEIKRFGDALREKLDDVESPAEAEEEFPEDGGNRPSPGRSTSWWGSDKRIDFVV